MEEYVVERFCRDAKAIELLGGNPEFLKNTIAAAFV
jgi:alkylation response protein AidB-like acyl-CoA dehydrogenase